MYDESHQPGDDEGRSAGEETTLGLLLGRAVEPQIHDEESQADRDQQDRRKVHTQGDADGETGDRPTGRRVDDLS